MARTKTWLKGSKSRFSGCIVRFNSSLVWLVWVSIYDFVVVVVGGGDEWHRVGEVGVRYKKRTTIFEFCRLSPTLNLKNHAV